MARTAETIELLNINTGRANGRIPLKRYNAMKRALLKVIPRRSDGVAYAQLKQLAPRHLPAWWHDEGWSVAWHIAVVKLDLEARGELERVPAKRPMHVRRVRRVK